MRTDESSSILSDAPPTTAGNSFHRLLADLLAVLDAKDGVRHSLALKNHPLVGLRHRLPRSLGLPPVRAFAGSPVHLGPGPSQQVPGL